MAFWGIEVKPGKPYIHRYDDERGRLHISQATLGAGSSTTKGIVQCKVGDKKPIYLCSLMPERLETCALNLEFDAEDTEMTFSVVGPHSVHLSGFFYGGNEDQNNDGDDYGSPYEEDIMEIDSEDDVSIDYDSEDDDDDDDDDYIDDEIGMYPPSPVPNSGVRIEEIVDDEKPANENGMSKRVKKKKTQPSISDDNQNSNRHIVPRAGTGSPVFESEDEDGFPLSVREKEPDISECEATVKETRDEINGEKIPDKSEKTDAASGKKLKRKSEAVSQEEKTARQPETMTSENETKQKKSKKKKVLEKREISQENGMPSSSGKEESSVAEIRNDMKPASEKKKGKKKKKQNKQQQEHIPTSIAEENITDKNGSVLEKQEKEEAKSSQVRSFPNGLVIEELKMGKPDGKRAYPGNKVSVHYIGKLKKNGKIFDSNIGRAPFKFRLGIGQVIKGWDVGINGMRIGDKRRLTIPPAMGYGAKGCGPAIPPNSWLVFDVELVSVN